MRYIAYAQLGDAGVLSVNEVAHVLRIGRTKTYELIKTGEIKKLPFKSPIRVSALWLKTYIDSQIPVAGNNSAA